MPLAVSATTFSGRIDVEVDEGVDVRRVVRQQVERVRLAAARRRSGASAPDAMSALMTSRPVSSPTGLAPARHSLMPLYCAGLCEPVKVAPGRSRLPAAK